MQQIGFARTVAGFQVSFHAQQSNGTLRTGLVAGDFVATAINPADTATSVNAVSQLASKTGVYTFLIPSAFFVAHGVGIYRVVVEINTFTGPSGAPNVRTCLSGLLKVSVEDIDTLATSVQATSIQADTDDIQARLPATLSSGRMRSQVEGMDAATITPAAVATDAIDADALAASAVAEIQAGLATAAAIAAIQADTDDIQTRLPATLNAGRMRSHVEALDATIADQIRVEVMTHVLEGNTLGLTLESTLNLMRKILNNRLELADGDTSNWLLYDDDDVSVELTYNVRDKGGGSILQPLQAPSRRTRGT